VFTSDKHQYRLRNLANANLRGASQVPPEVTAARQSIVKLMGEFSPKERWVEENSEAVEAEMQCLRGEGVTHKGIALQSMAIKRLYSDDIRKEFEDQPSHTNEDIA
jgi:hypothetical protein